MKKAVKPIKSKPKSKKSIPDKSAKKNTKTPVNKGGGKTVKKKEAVKVVKKAAKKIAKAVKKVPAKKITPKKIVKKLAKATKPAKSLKKVEKKAAKKILKPVKKPAAVTINKKTVVAKPAVKSKTAVKVDNKDTSKKEKELKKVTKIEISKEPKVKPPRKSKGGRKPKNKDDEDEPVIEEDILIEQLINSTKRLKKPTKVPKQLRTFTNPMASLTVANVADNKSKKALPKKEPKGKFELEYVIRTSPGILYEFLTSPSGLSEWFADDVNIHDGVFTFFWEGSEQKARLLAFKEEKFVRLQWLDKPEGTYFEFRIEKDELTGDISLMIVDFADEASDMETSKRLWDSQINTLLNVIGSY